MSREPRDRVLEVLYELDRRPDATPDLDEMAPRAARMANGVLSRTEELDALIADVSEGWSVERMPVIDRSVLRLGVYELVHERNTPVGVVIDEAVRLAKKYSTGESASFVNGVLSSLALRHREQPEEE